MLRVRPALAVVVPPLILVSACSDSLTAPSSTQLGPISAQPSIFTPILLPPGAKWGHYFNSFNRDRRLDAEVIQYYDGHVGGSGVFVIPGVGAGTLEVTKIESTSADCVPYGTPCDQAPEPKIPESSTSSGVGQMGHIPLTFTLELQSHLWPPPGWTPGSDPGTDYDTATLTICPAGAPCTTTTFYGELHHEPT